MARMGRPPLYNNCMDFAAMCEMYFEKCDKRVVGEENKPEPYLITGLAIYLDLTTEALLEYGKRDDFSLIIKKAKDVIKHNLQMISIDQPQKAAGTLFNLKCNHNMNEKIQVDLNAEMNVKSKMVYVDPRDNKESE